MDNPDANLLKSAPRFSIISIERIIETSLGNKSFIKEMVEMLLGEIPLFIGKAKKYASENKYIEFANEIHKLKNSLLLLGFESQRKNLNALEELSQRNPTTGKINDLFKKVTKEWADASTDIENLKIWMSNLN